MKTLSIAEVIEKMNNVGKGEFHNISFYSEKKAKDGTIIRKIAETQLQTGVNYKHTKYYNEPTYNRDEDSTYLVDNSIKINNKTGNYLLTITPMWETYKTRYEDLYGNPISKAVAESLLPEKKKSNTLPSKITPNAKNVLFIH